MFYSVLIAVFCLDRPHQTQRNVSFCVAVPLGFSLSTVELPALSLPMCSYCLLLLSKPDEHMLVTGLQSWKDHKRAAANSTAKYTAAEFVFGVTWGVTETSDASGGTVPTLESSSSPCQEAIRLPPESLVLLGRGAPSSRKAAEWREVTNSYEIQSRGVSKDNHPKFLLMSLYDYPVKVASHPCFMCACLVAFVCMDYCL